MRHDEFIGQVQHHARLSSRGDAERATRAMLETLAERLAGNEPFDLAAQLPREIGHYLQHHGAGKGEHLSLDEFFKRVSIREGVDLPDAVFHARAVAAVLVDAVSHGEMRDVFAQLPEEYNRLFAGSEGAMPRDLRRPHLG
jgi:uncharacterized protein (DUF2267 family)